MEQIFESVSSLSGAVVLVDALTQCFCALLEAWFDADCAQAFAQRICGDRCGSVGGWADAQLFKRVAPGRLIGKEANHGAWYTAAQGAGCGASPAVMHGPLKLRKKPGVGTFFEHEN